MDSRKFRIAKSKWTSFGWAFTEGIAFVQHSGSRASHHHKLARLFHVKGLCMRSGPSDRRTGRGSRSPGISSQTRGGETLPRLSGTWGWMGNTSLDTRWSVTVEHQTWKGSQWEKRRSKLAWSLQVSLPSASWASAVPVSTFGSINSSEHNLFAVCLEQVA